MIIRPTRQVFICAVVSSVIAFATTAAVQDQKAAHLPGSNPVSGARLYKQYCAVCHGIDLRGRGPLATEPKTPPPDLTTLAHRHGGKFPDSYVEDVLRSGVRTPAHGDSEMPIWGPLFASIRGTDPALVDIRIASLTAYIKSMQAE
ncbi:MAG: cytochrome c [Candidatus Sulfotelmatobacter sp.]